MSKAPRPVDRHSFIERLEPRQLLAGDTSVVRPLPFVLEFGTDHASTSLHDKDGQGTGFTYVQANRNGNEYDPSLIDLRPEEGVLRLTTAGNVQNQGNYGKDNTQINALQTQFDPGDDAFTITTRLKGPLRPIAQAYEQAGILFGPDQDNWVKLVMIATTDSVGIQFIDEQKVGTKLVRTLKSTAYTPLPALHAVQTLDLILSGTPVNGQMAAYARVNGGALVRVPGVLQLSEAKADYFFSNKSRAGVYTAQANELPPEIMVFDRFVIEPGKVNISRPDITAVRPEHRTTGADRLSFVAADVFLPTSGIDESTVSSSTVKLYRTSDGQVVDAVRNTSGGGDAIVITPHEALAANTKYTFEVTSGLKDLSGAAFIPHQTEFTTGTNIGNTDGSISFTQHALSAATNETFGGVAIGPDNKLYATSLSGEIFRFNINSDGTLSSKQTINTIIDNNGGPRAITGIAFDPASTADNLIAYVTHGQAEFENASDWTGKLTRISGANLDSYSDWVVGLPRSIRDHLTNQLAFSPGGQLFFLQGSNTAMGAPDNAWGMREERAMNAAVIVVDPQKLRRRIKDGGGPVDVKSADGGTYDPFNTTAPVGLYATGVRNAYDLVWHSNGHLYVPTNGSAAGGNTPGTPSDPFSNQRIDASWNGPYEGPSIDPINNIQATQDDYLFDIIAGGYYGHPNPVRSEYVLNGGNPTAGADPQEVADYPIGTMPDRNYRRPAFTFGKNYSPNGVIEYRSNAAGGKLQGKLLVTRYSGGDDIVVLSLDDIGRVTGAATGIEGLTGFTDPLDLIEDTRNGNLYVVEHGGQKITLLKPNAVTEPPPEEPPPTPGSGSIRVNSTKRLYNDVRGGSASAEERVVITNNGSGNLTITGASISGSSSGQFEITDARSFPFTLAPGGRTSIGVAFNPPSDTAAGIKIATLDITSNDPSRPTQQVRLRGLATTGTGGSNEPSLQRILELHEISVQVGDSNSADTALDNPLATPNDEVALPRLAKAGSGPVTIEPVAVFGVASDPAVKLGWYEPGTSQSRQELLMVDVDDAQSVTPNFNGSTSFDPGGNAFGIYSVWPGFANSDGSVREVFSEDSLNAFEPDSSKRRKIRFYPLKDRDGSVVANAYVMAHEEVAGSGDFQDVVAVIRNVMPAPDSSRELGFENLDGLPYHNRMVFNRIGVLDAETPNTPHDTAKLRVRNTGTSPLTLGRTTVSGSFQLIGAPAEGTTIAGGSHLDLTVRFNATSGEGVHQGRLTVNSNDADEPAKGVELLGYFQPRSENNQEPSLATLVSMFGYSTVITYPGENINENGLVTTVGEEVLSRYWKRADASAPVTVRQLAAYHTMGDIPFVAWHNKGSNTINELYRHTETDGQNVLPRKRGTLGPAFAAFNPAGTFGFNVDRAWSDDTKNPQEVNDGNHGHAVRFFPAKDREGRILNNTWIMVMDYYGVNYDYNDNVYLVTNMRPENRPSPPMGFTAMPTPGQVTLNWADYTGSDFDGYFVYRSTNPFTGFQRLNDVGLTASEFVDTATEPRGTTIYYRVVVNAPSSSVQASTLTKLV